jgi:hypothetical protein
MNRARGEACDSSYFAHEPTIKQERTIMASHPWGVFRSNSIAGRVVCAGTVALALGWLAGRANAQTLIYQEGFNSDGETNVPPRYTTTGRGIYEVPQIQSALTNYDQKGPIYWAHNFNVSYVGNPGIPGRRMIFPWRGTDTSMATEDMLKLFDSSVNWLLDGKPNARIVVNPNGAEDGAITLRCRSEGPCPVLFSAPCSRFYRRRSRNRSGRRSTARGCL